jgi:hypothetical protein
MTMQYDVSSVHLNQSGFGYMGRTRVKGLTISSTATGGAVSIFDSATAPVSSSVTYGRSGTTVTVASTAHGLSTGDKVGIAFAVGTGGSATNGNYVITRTSADAFTLVDINSGTITATPAAIYVSNSATSSNSTQWHGSFDTAAAAAITNIVFPGEGFLIENALYITMTATNITAVTAFYG